ncbi:MAG: hypothetical protein WBP29_13875 [Candidatus Zixiibacteriota bacterium]
MNLLKKSLIILAVTAAILTLSWKPVYSQSVGESLLNKGDSIAVYVDAEDFEAMKAARSGQTVKLKVLENVMKFDKKLINKGQTVFASVIKRSRGGAYAGSGNMTIKFDSTFSSAKTMIPLRGSAQFKGKSGAGKKIISIVLFPIGWLIKGGDIQFPEGKNVWKPVVVDDTPLKYQK